MAILLTEREIKNNSNLSEQINLLLETGKLLKKNSMHAARRKVEQLILPKVDIHTPDSELLAHIMATSLLERIGKKLLESKNIYLQEFDIPQIELFYKMTEAYPQVACSHRLANHYLASLAVNYAQVTVFDIGIGKGRQTGSLLENLAAQKARCRCVVVIGLDPDPNNLRDAEKLYTDLQSRSPFAISFIPICNLIENFTSTDWEFIKRMGGDCLLVNSAYAMHHIQHPLYDNSARLNIFRKICGLRPQLITLTEPNADHDTNDISQRIKNCYTHFKAAFEVITESDIGAEHKFLIKEKFFGREINNIFSVSDYLRSERHEAISNWLLHLNRAGFEPYTYPPLKPDLPSYCWWKADSGIVELGYGQTSLVGVFAYKPKSL